MQNNIWNIIIFYEDDYFHLNNEVLLDYVNIQLIMLYLSAYDVVCHNFIASPPLLAK